MDDPFCEFFDAPNHTILNADGSTAHRQMLALAAVVE